jgi:hypothetical protein
MKISFEIKDSQQADVEGYYYYYYLVVLDFELRADRC